MKPISPFSMSQNRVNLVFLLVLLGSVSEGLDISTIFTVCKVHDPNLNECLKGSIQAAILKLADGLKELNTPILDPLAIEEAKMPAGAGAGAVRFEQTLKNLKIYNIFRFSKILSADAILNPNGFEIDIDAFTPDVKFEADYEINGKILLLPIYGSGKCIIDLENVESKVHVIGETIKEDGKVFGNIKTMNLEFLPKKVKFQFDNLFNGDPVIGREVNALLNEKWEDIFHDVRDNYSKFISDFLMKSANEIFHHVEFGSLFIE